MQQKPSLIILVTCIGLLILSILFISFKDRLDPSQQIVDLTIKNKQLVSPKDPINIKKGKRVTLLIKGDEDEQFHLEGYHAFTSFKANEVTKLKFEALTAGKFPAYLDKSRTYLGTVEVIE